MNAILAIDGLSATHPRQRARCARTGRFVAWKRVPSLRLASSRGVVEAPAPVVRAPIVSAPVVSVSAPVVRVVRVPAVSAVRSVAVRAVRSVVHSAVRAVRSIGRAFGVIGRTGRADIGGDVPT